MFKSAPLRRLLQSGNSNVGQSFRHYSTRTIQSKWRGFTNRRAFMTATVIATVLSVGVLNIPHKTILAENPETTREESVRQAIRDILEDYDYDDGSYGPVIVRLAWHASGSYDKKSKTGGSEGAYMRFPQEAGYGANAGLEVARNLLEPVKKQFPWISYADLWTLAGCVAIEEMGGPRIHFRFGRKDAPSSKGTAPDGRLPDASKDQRHVRDIFNRMGFSDREIVALIGAHCLGRCHRNRSGYEGPWNFSPTTFSNLYFVELLNRNWIKKKWDGPDQYVDAETGELMMLPADMALKNDPKLKRWVELYAKDQDLFFHDFALAFSKLIHLGMGGVHDEP